MAQVPPSTPHAGVGQRVSSETPSAANDRQTGDASTIPRLSSGDGTNRSALQAWFVPVAQGDAGEFGQVALVRRKNDVVIQPLREEQGREDVHASHLLVKIAPPPIGPLGSRECYQGRAQTEKMQLQLLAGDGFPGFKFDIGIRQENKELAGARVEGTPPEIACEVTRERLFEDGKAVQRATVNWGFTTPQVEVRQELKVQWRAPEEDQVNLLTVSGLCLEDSVVVQGGCAEQRSGEDC